MNNYEELLACAGAEGLTVKEKPLISSDGRISSRKIAIRLDLETSTEKACVLAEELGHYHTSTGDIIDLTDIRNLKQEHIARLWAYNKMIGLIGIVKAFETGCRNCYEIAEYLGVTEAFLKDALGAYRLKYGEKWISIDNYFVRFEPQVDVVKMLV